jgi:hypothetical protein
MSEKALREIYARAQVQTVEQFITDTPIVDGHILAASAEPIDTNDDLKATNGPLLDLDVLLAAFHKAVWDACERGAAYDEAGVDAAKAIQQHVRAMIAASAGQIRDAILEEAARMIEIIAVDAEDAWADGITPREVCEVLASDVREMKHDCSKFAAPTPAAAQQTCDRIVCEREGKCVDDDVARGERCQYLPAAAAQDERGAFAYPTIEHWITEIAGEREIGHVISEMTHMEVARQAFAAARAAASPVSGEAGGDARDAARYRFIRSQMRVGSVQTQLPLYRTLHWIGYEDCNDVRDADEAIDAEIERGERAEDKS